MKSLAYKLHTLFNQQTRFHYPFEYQINEIPENGVYIMFERGETFHDLDRIVRIGSHTGEGQLRSRLNEHFSNMNKNRSIYRKNIGRCILNKYKSNYLPLWDLDTTSAADKEKNLKLLDLDFEKMIEKEISEYIQSNLSFCVFEVKSKEERLFWETKIISTLAQSNELIPSSNWLGNFSTKEKIRSVGLWQVQNLNEKTLTEDEFNKLQLIVRK